MSARTIDFESTSRLLVAGRLEAAEDDVELINPSTGLALVRAPMASLAQLHAAIDAARQCGAAWAADADRRSAAMMAIASTLRAHRDDFATAISLETGVPFKNAQDEVAMAAGFLEYRAQSRTAVDTLHDDKAQKVQVVRRAIGVVGAIVPWNAPMLIACEKIGTAFAAGDTVIVKPSPLAPLALLMLGQRVAGHVPAGALSILPGSDQLGAALVAHEHVPMISFTGSTEAGRAIMAAAAPRLKRLSLELGGNDAAIVLPDVNIPKTAARLFMGAFYRSGQICAAIKRLYVHRDAYPALLAELTRLAEAAVIDDPFVEGVTMGPLSNAAQFAKLKRLMQASLAAGAKCVTGGAPLSRPGYFHSPTLVTDLAGDNPLVTEEQFGPALPVLAFADVDSAVAAANGTAFGLGGSVWTDDVERGLAIARRLECGTAWVNRHGLVLPDIPFGGMKQSGIGRANGTPGLDAYAELQTISVALPRK